MQTLEQLKFSSAIEAILLVLGEPEEDFQAQALEDYNNGNDQSVKIYAATHLQDYYCKCLAFLVSVKPTAPNLPTLLSAAATAASDHAQHRTLRKLNESLHIAFTSENPSASAIKAVLNVLEPITDLHRTVIATFSSADPNQIKTMAASNLEDQLLKSLTYLCSATKPSPALPTIVAEAARAAAEHSKVKALRHLSLAIAQALK